MISLLLRHGADLEALWKGVTTFQLLWKVCSISDGDFRSNISLPVLSASPNEDLMVPAIKKEVFLNYKAKHFMLLVTKWHKYFFIIMRTLTRWIHRVVLCLTAAWRLARKIFSKLPCAINKMLYRWPCY